MKKLVSVIAAGVFFAAGIANINAQDEETSKDTTKQKSGTVEEQLTNLDGKIIGLNEGFLETQSIVKKLAKLKISGYMQAQYALAETLGVATSKAGTSFDKGTNSRFFIRRGRLKFNYDNGLSQYVLQFDASSAGFEIKDAYISATEPWLKNFTGTIGIFDRPFGYEISYSSSMRESPERSRIYQTLFPKEREIGAKLAFAAESGPLSYFNVKAGVFNGVTPLQLENDCKKDYIGRVGFELPLRSLGMAIDGGFSAYLGSVRNTDTTKNATKSFKKMDTTWVTKSTVNDSGKVVWSASRKVDSSFTYTYSNPGLAYEMDGNKFSLKTGQLNKNFDRTYIGFDLQYFYDVPVVGGLTLRGEYLQGTQPGTSGSSSFYQPSAGQVPNGSLYLRDFAGFYLYWVQCVGSRVQTVLKYDVYDPNSAVSGDDIGAKGTFTGATDLAFSTLGIGAIFHWDENVKVMVYYDMPTNETSTNLKNADPYKDYSRDMPDNVLTIRVQYKF